MHGGRACLKARLNFFWRTGGVLGGSSLALPLKVIGSDSCILAADHLLWHSLGSNWRQKPRSHTCPSRHIWTRCIYRGLSCMPFPPRLPRYTSRLVDSPCRPHLRRHPHCLLAKVGRYMQNAPKQMSCRMCLLWYTAPSLQPRVLLEVHKSRGDGRSGHLFHRR